MLVTSYRIRWVDPIPPLPRRFRRTAVVFRRYRPPSSCETGFILSCALLVSRVPSRVDLPARSRAPSLGSSPSSRHQLEESTWRWASQARLRSARSVSHALDGLLLPAPCALVSSRSRVQGSRSRGLIPTIQPYHLVGDRFPRVVRVARLPVARRQRTSRRPQGLAPARGP